jgi:hypothetical protein
VKALIAACLFGVWTIIELKYQGGPNTRHDLQDELAKVLRLRAFIQQPFPDKINKVVKIFTVE